MIQNIFCSPQNTIVNEQVIINNISMAIFSENDVIWVASNFKKILVQ